MRPGRPRRGRGEATGGLRGVPRAPAVAVRPRAGYARGPRRSALPPPFGPRCNRDEDPKSVPLPLPALGSLARSRPRARQRGELSGARAQRGRDADARGVWRPEFGLLRAPRPHGAGARRHARRDRALGDRPPHPTALPRRLVGASCAASGSLPSRAPGARDCAPSTTLRSRPRIGSTTCCSTPSCAPTCAPWKSSGPASRRRARWCRSRPRSPSCRRVAVSSPRSNPRPSPGASRP